MTTGIRTCRNESDAWISVVNNETRSDSRICQPKDTNDDLYLWISQHYESRPSVQTKKGLMWIVDDSWKIYGQWEWSHDQTKLADVDYSTQDFTLVISDEGNISLEKR